MAETFKFGNTKWAVKENSILAYNNENNNFKPLPFDFTRASIATRVNEEGLIEVVKSGIPRIDYLDNPSGHLLLEPSRSNIYPYSENFSLSSFWIILNAILNAENFISPNGELNAFKLEVETTSTTIISIRESVSVSQNVQYSFSIFLKEDEMNVVQLTFRSNDVTGNPRVNFNLSTGEIGSDDLGNSKIENYGNGWYRCSVSFETQTTSVQVYVCGIVNDTDARFQSASWNAGDGFYIYGAQLELGSYATSYIPTNGTTETRVAETCTGAGNAQVFNDSEGVLFLNVAALANDATARGISINDGTVNNRVFFYYENVSNNIAGYVEDLTTSIIYTMPDITEFNKIALKYKTGETALWANSNEVGTNTQAFSQSGLKEIKFNNANGASIFYGKIKQIGVYDTALTDEELETLTT